MFSKKMPLGRVPNARSAPHNQTSSIDGIADLLAGPFSVQPDTYHAAVQRISEVLDGRQLDLRELSKALSGESSSGLAKVLMQAANDGMISLVKDADGAIQVSEANPSASGLAF